MLLSILQSLYLSNGTRFVIASIFSDEVDFVNKSMHEVVDGNTAMCSGLFWWCCLLVLAEIFTLFWCFGFYCHYACSWPVKNCYKDILSIFVWSLHWLHIFCVLWAIIITFRIFLVYCLVNMKYTILFYSIQFKFIEGR